MDTFLNELLFFQMKTKLDNCERDMKKLKEHHSQEMEQMQKDYEEKIAVLLQQINSKKIVENCEKCDKLEGKLRTIEVRISCLRFSMLLLLFYRILL